MFEQREDHSGQKDNQPAYRKHLTAFNSIINVLDQQAATRSLRDRRILQPHFQWMRHITTPSFNRHNPADPICSHFLLHGFNRLQKAPVHAGCWSSDGRRLVLGTQLGEFNLWEGDTFKFEKLVTTHQHPIRAMAWSTNGQMLLSGDHQGIIKYFNASMTNIKNIPEAHESAVRGLSFAPTESKYVSCSDDNSVKVWDWERGTPDVEYKENEHLSDVKCAEWHPFRSLIATGSKDNTVKLWDPRQSRSLSTLHGHKNTVLCASWNASGNLLATGSRDHLIKVYDIRTMSEYAVLRGHQKEVSSLKWHPIQEALLLSGGFNGTLIYWVMGYAGPHTIIANAHNYSVNVIAWHPLGHCVASSANDGILKFWCREPPGSLLKNEPRHDWQDASLALKISYGPSRNILSLGTTESEKTPGKKEIPSNVSVPTKSEREKHDSARVSNPTQSTPSSGSESYYTGRGPVDRHAHADQSQSSHGQGQGRDRDRDRDREKERERDRVPNDESVRKRSRFT